MGAVTELKQILSENRTAVDHDEVSGARGGARLSSACHLPGKTGASRHE